MITGYSSSNRRGFAARLLAGLLLSGLPLAASEAGPGAPDSAGTPVAVPETSATASTAIPAADTAAKEGAIDLGKTTVTGRSRALTRKESGYVARMPLRNLENPQSYIVVPKELTEQQMAVDFNSAFKNIPGSSKAGQWMQGSSQFYTRGFISTAEVRNGLSVNVVTDVDPVNVERIEAIRGPAGALFGSGTGISYGGLFNVVTKAPTGDFMGSVTASGGSWNLGRVTADVNVPLNPGKTLLMRVNLAKHYEGSFMDQGYSDAWAIAPSLTYKVNDRLKLSLDVDAYQREGTSILSTSLEEGITARNAEDLRIGYGRSFLNNGLVTESRNTSIYARADYRLTPDWSSESVVAVSNSQSDLASIYLRLVDDSLAVRTLDDQAWKVNTRQVQQNFRGEYSTGIVRNQMLVGFGVSAFDYLWPYTIDNDTVNYRDIGPDYYVGQDVYRARIGSLPLQMWSAETYNYNAYLSDAVHLGDRFTALLGIRWDRFDDRGASDGLSEKEGKYEQDAFSPKLGLVYRPVKDALALYTSYMSGFKNVSGRNYEKEIFVPEHAHQGEVGAKIQAAGGRLAGTVAVYGLQVQDVVRGDLDHPGFSVQDGTQNSWGVEFDVSSQPIPGLDLIAGYAWNHSELTKSESDVEGRRPPSAGPELAANFWASYEIPGGPAQGLGAGLGGNYASRAYYRNSDSFVFIVPAYMLLDASVFYDQPTWRAGLKVDNLTSEKYWSPDALQAGAPRRLIGNITYKF